MLSLKKSFTEQPARPEEAQAQAQAQDEAQAQEEAHDDAQEEAQRTISYDRVYIESEVNTDVIGSYEVLYSFEDTISKTGTGKVRLYVVVTDGG